MGTEKQMIDEMRKHIKERILLDLPNYYELETRYMMKQNPHLTLDEIKAKMGEPVTTDEIGTMIGDAAKEVFNKLFNLV